MRAIIKKLDDKFTIDKFSGCTIVEVLKYNPDYIFEWFLKNTDGTYCALSTDLLPAIRTMFPNIVITKDLEESMHRMQQNFDNLTIAESRRNSRCLYFESDDEYDDEYGRDTYDRYCGSYAQDEMGYSDDDIDTIFDGDPSAYWNID